MKPKAQTEHEEDEDIIGTSKYKESINEDFVETERLSRPRSTDFVMLKKKRPRWRLKKGN